MGSAETDKEKKGGFKVRYVLWGIIPVILVIVVMSLFGKAKPGTGIYDAIKAGDHEKLSQILKKTKPAALNRPLKNDFFSRMAEKENPTPLQYACEAGDLETVRMLVEAGADVNAPMVSYDWGNPLWYANNRRKDRDRFKVIKYLIDAGADCTGSENAMKEMLRLTHEEKEDEALCLEELEAFRSMYEQNAASLDVSMTEAYPNLLIRAVMSNSPLVVKFLVEQGYPVDPEPDAASGHAQVQTPLCEAAAAADVQAVEYLLSVGADVTLRDMDNKTPLEAVIQKKNKVETEDWLRSERDRLDDYDRVIEILRQAEK